jgi:hypothetical protein
MAYAVPLNYVMVAWIKWPDYWTYAVVNTVTFTVLSILLKFVVRRAFNQYDQIGPTTKTGSR